MDWPGEGLMAEVLEKARADLSENAKGLADKLPKYGHLTLNRFETRHMR